MASLEISQCWNSLLFLLWFGYGGGGRSWLITQCTFDETIWPWSRSPILSHPGHNNLWSWCRPLPSIVCSLIFCSTLSMFPGLNMGWWTLSPVNRWRGFVNSFQRQVWLRGPWSFDGLEGQGPVSNPVGPSTQHQEVL